MGVSLTTVEALRTANHDAVHLRDEGLIRLPDPKIAAKAVAESRIVLTFDLDFGDILAIAGSTAPSVIIFRLRNQTPGAVTPRLFQVIAGCAQELAEGAIVIVEDEDFASGGYRYDADSESLGNYNFSLNCREAEFSGVIWNQALLTVGDYTNEYNATNTAGAKSVWFGRTDGLKC